MRPAILKTTNGDLDLPEAFKNQATVLFFYPRNFTSGCTRQARHFSDSSEDFKAIGCHVFGVNDATLENHKDFLLSENLRVPLISDTEHRLAELFSVFGTHKVKDIEYTGYRRDVVILDKNLEVIFHQHGVNPDESHVVALEFLKQWAQR